MVEFIVVYTDIILTLLDKLIKKYIMPWLACDRRKKNNEFIYDTKPERITVGTPSYHHWSCDSSMVWLPDGTIEKIIGYKPTWKNEPIELK